LGGLSDFVGEPIFVWEPIFDFVGEPIFVFVWEPIFDFVWEPIFDFVWEPISYGISTGNGGDMGLWGKDLDLEFRFDLEADFRFEFIHISYIS
jgi:hypothetical protein